MKATNKKQLQISQEKESMTLEDYKGSDLIKGGLVVFSFLNMILLFIRYAYAICRLESRIMSNSIFYILFSITLTVSAFMLSTTLKYWNFRNRKKAYYTISIIAIYMTVLQPLYTFLWKTIVPRVFRIKVSAAMTEGMVVLAAYICQIAAFSFCCAWIVKLLWEVTFSKAAYDKITVFKLEKIMDIRPNSKYMYDAKVIWNLVTSKLITLKMQDRFLQTLLIGASGTGKTSSVIITEIIGDLNTKLQNFHKRISIYKKYLDKGIFGVRNTGNCFSEQDIYVKSKQNRKWYERKLKKIKEKYPDCGITTIAPNNAIIEDHIKAAIARGQDIYVIDPVKDWSYMSPLVHMAGINQFYLPRGITIKAAATYINKNATIFSDVLVAASEIYDRIETYFKDVNTSIASHIATVTQLYFFLRGEQTDIIEVRDAINDFSILAEYVAYIEERLGVFVPMNGTKGGGSPLAINAGSVTSDNKLRDDRRNPFYQSLHFVKNELLGEGAEKMTDQARGLRNIINKLLSEPNIKELLAADEAHRVSIDELLANNGQIAVNTALELGPVISTSFGITFLMQHKASVTRRPMHLRSPHYIYVDEASQYLHPFMEDFYTLYRQYKVGVLLAFQSLAQMDRSQLTKYLKGIVKGAGIHILFGRGGTEEMEFYEKIAGLENQEVIQDTVSQNSLLSKNATKSFSRRTTPGTKGKFTEQDIRLMDFQDVLVFRSDQGNIMNGELGTVNFSKPADYKKRKVLKLPYELYADDPSGDLGKHPEQAPLLMATYQTQSHAYSMLDFGVQNISHSLKGVQNIPLLVRDKEQTKIGVTQYQSTPQNEQKQLFSMQEPLERNNEESLNRDLPDNEESGEPKHRTESSYFSYNTPTLYEQETEAPKISLSQALKEMYTPKKTSTDETFIETDWEIEPEYKPLEPQNLTDKDISSFLKQQT